MSKLLVTVTATSFARDSRLQAEAHKRFPNLDFKFCNPSQPWTKASLCEAIKATDFWIIGKEDLGTHELQSAPNLKGVSKYGVGLDNIDFEACSSFSVPVYFEQGVNSQEVAEQAIAMMIGLSRNLFSSAQNLHQGIWVKNGGNNFSGKIVSIIGCGHVGEKVARLSKAFSCEVLVNDTLDKSAICNSIGAEQVELEEALSRADFISLHVPFTEQTYNMISKSSLTLVKRGVFIVNTSRGEVVDLEAIKQGIEGKVVSGFGADVFKEEPFEDKSLFNLGNIHGTAHIAGNSREAVWKMGQAALNGIEKFLLDQ